MLSFMTNYKITLSSVNIPKSSRKSLYFEIIFVDALNYEVLTN